MKPKLLTVADHGTRLNLGFDRGVCVFNTYEAIIVQKNVVDPQKTSSNQVWSIGRVYRMHNFFGNCWVEYRDPIDLTDRPSNTWRLVYVGIKKEPTISGCTIL